MDSLCESPSYVDGEADERVGLAKERIMESVEDNRVTSLLSRVEGLKTRLETLLNSQDYVEEEKEDLEKLVQWSEICVSALRGVSADGVSETESDVKTVDEMLRIIEEQSESVHHGLESM